jgi:hypothetical protein
MTKKDNLYSEVVINESPFYYDDHGRLRVHVLNEAQYISTADMRIDPVTGKKGPSKTIKISKDIPQQQSGVTDKMFRISGGKNFAPFSRLKPSPQQQSGSGMYGSGNKVPDDGGMPYDPSAPNPKFSGMVRDPVTDKTGPSKTIKISKDITGMPVYGNDEPNSDMIARPAVMPPADRERPLPGTARIAVPRPDTARPPSNMKRPLPLRRAPAPVRGRIVAPAPVRGQPLRPIGGRPGLGRLSPIRSIVGSGRNTNIRTGLRGVRPAARAMQKSAPATDYLNEKMNLKNAKMGDVIKDFQKSDAPQFEGKSKAKRRIMAIAAKLGAERMSERD